MTFKKIFASITFCCLLLLGFIHIAAAERVSLRLEYDGRTELYDNEKITLNVNEKVIDGLPMPPIILNERTYVPVSEVFRAMGAVVDWKDETKQVYIGYGDNVIILQIGQSFINVNGEIRQIPVSPRIINGKTMVPVSFAADALGFFVHWDGPARTVTIIDPNSNPQQTAPPTPAASPSPEPAPQDGGPFVESGEPVQGPYIEPKTDPNVETAIPIASFARDISGTVMTDGQYPTTRITGVTAGPNSYTINASSEISSVVKTLLKDNRFIIDIINAEDNTPAKTLNFANSYLKSIRVAQNQVEPEKVTRVVFDITAAVSFSVTMAPDRKSITVTFEKNYITDVSFVPEGAADRLYISGITAPMVTLGTLENPKRLVIDLPLSNMLVPLEIPVNGAFVSRMRSSQFDADSSRIVLELTGNASYSVSKMGSTTIITISRQTFQGVSYNAATRTITLSKPAGQQLDISKIVHIDDYLNLKYSLVLPGNYSNTYGSGTHLTNDSYVSVIETKQLGGNTALTISEGRILAYIVTEDATNIYIRAVLPKEKYSKIVVIDPGHGLSDPGTNGHGLIEKNINLDIAVKLAALMEADGGVKCYSTRLEDTYPTRTERAIFANEVGDIFVSIHNNALDAKSSSKGIANGTETYYYPHANDAALGYSSQSMAAIFQKNLVADLGTTDRKHKYGDLQVLRETAVPAVLCEIAFMDHAGDAANLGSDAFRQRVAASLKKSILQTFDVYKPKR